ncbi:MAG: prepilin-type N-terminal cleavage/methylation domain-containing protein [Planctomycetota bacterium]
MSSPHTRPTNKAFTLVELLVVIGIIVVLVALTIGVGTSVANAGRQRATEGALRALDEVLDSYLQSQGSAPAFVLVEESRLPDSSLIDSDKDGYYPLFDGLSEEDNQPVNTVGLFLIEARRSVPATEDIISALDAKFIRQFQPGSAADAIQPETLTVFDAWGNPIRMVHPRFDGEIVETDRSLGDPGDSIDLGDSNSGFLQGTEAFYSGNGQLGLETLRRNALSEADTQETPGLVGDSDGGICPSPRPYFYSAGPDGDPSTRDDNVYTALPRFES